MGNTQGFGPGTVLDERYRLDARIGSGGMGTVYRATHLLLDKSVAVKVMSVDNVDEGALQRMVREAKLASAVSHPNVIAVTDMGIAAEQIYIVMELLEGRDLADLLSRGAFPWRRAANILMQALSGLEAIHRKGIVHRDLKPHNLMLVRRPDGENIVKVLDFGISKFFARQEGEEVLTKSGAVLGTPAYMAPEQALGERLTQRVDIYAMGAVFYQMVTGRRVFEGPNPMAIIAQTLEGVFPAPSEIVPGLPTRVDQFTGKALARDPHARFATVTEMKAALATVLGDETGALTLHHVEPASHVPETPTYPLQTAVGLPEQQPPETAAGPPPIDSRNPSHQHLKPPLALTAPLVASQHFRAASEPALELDLDARRPSATQPAVDRRRPLPVRPLVLTAVALGGGILAWNYWEQLSKAAQEASDTVSSQAVGQDTVLVHVRITPKDAQLFVNDTPIRENPIPIPKSSEFVKLRAEAPGFEPSVLQLQPDRSRSVSMSLNKRRKR